MQKMVTFVAGLVLGIMIAAICAWGFISYSMKIAAESDSQFTPEPVKELVKAGAELQAAKNEYERWLALGNVGLWNVDAGALNIATDYAQELLALAENYKKDWNYGNAIHKGNLILGRVALRKDDRAKAREYLLAAGRTPGSPQLDTFGPNMVLAKEFLERGEKDVVLEYFSLCGVFWKQSFGRLSAWRGLVQEGKTPNFGANVLY
jgi:hypothetical protein